MISRRKSAVCCWLIISLVSSFTFDYGKQDLGTKSIVCNNKIVDSLNHGGGDFFHEKKALHEK